MSILKMHRMKRISSLDGLKAIMMLSIHRVKNYDIHRNS